MDLFNLNTIGWGGIAALYMLDRFGILEKILPNKKNGSNGNGHKEIIELKEQISILQDNHLHAIVTQLEEMNKKFDEHMKIEIANSIYLQEIVKKLDK